MFSTSFLHRRLYRLTNNLLLLGLSLAILSTRVFAQDDKSQPNSATVASQLANTIPQVEQQVKHGWVKDWLRCGGGLPQVEAFTINVDGREILVDEEMFYVGRFGSPFAYARALDLVAETGLGGLARKRVLDFGYGSIASVRMMAMAGAEVTGIDVSPIVQAMYADHSGVFGNGKVRLLHGRFPKEENLVTEVGTNYDLIISKNTLKKGYIHPSRPADPRMLVDLGVDDATFLKGLHDILAEKGLVIIYNICPAKAAPDQAYIPWAEGENPFTKEQWQSSGFEILQYDIEDHDAARSLGRALGWDQGTAAMNLEKDIFAFYSIMRRQD